LSREIIPKLFEASLKFKHVDKSRLVSVNVCEYPSPILDVLMVTSIRDFGFVAVSRSTYFEDALELVKRDCATVIRVLFNSDEFRSI
jgi:hypothetical protein